MGSEVYDVTVVGAGPAGARLAWRLARAGAAVALVDASHPREKPCGGGVTGRALQLVADQIDGAMIDAVAVSRARFAQQDVRAEVPLPVSGITPASALVIASRSTFDRMLLDRAVAAGAVHLRARARDAEAGRDACAVALSNGETVRSRLLAGADGAASAIRRRVLRPFDRAALSIGTGFFVHGVSDDAVDVEFESNPPGYLWSFPRPDHLAVGICAQADRSTPGDLRAVAAKWIATRGLDPSARLQPYSWPIPSLSAEAIRRERPAAGRWLLIGDAAGLVDPLTREGIFFALLSADLAADAIVTGSGPAENYLERLSDEVLAELARAAALKAGFFDPRFTKLLVQALRVSHSVQEVMADLVAGRQPYRTLVRRLVSTLEVRLAWQLFRLWY